MTKLKRTISLPLITLYGMGTIVGAGIYVLSGKVAATAGIYSPFAFAISALIALFTGFSYAELAARFPLCAGEAVYVDKAFKNNWLSSLIGWTIALTGIISSATMLHGFVGYLSEFIIVPEFLIITILALILCIIATIGVKHSTTTVAVITIIKLIGIFFVIYSARSSFKQIPNYIDKISHIPNPADWSGIFNASFLAFYAYIGFEDMVNMAEEVKNPQKNLPIAIFISLFVATILYIVVSTVAINAIPILELAASSAPLALVVEKTSNFSPKIISLISLFTIISGALVQIVMASRMIYGMSKTNSYLKLFNKISPTTHTPILATIFVVSLILLFAYCFPLLSLAKLTSFIILIIFIIMNLSLLIIKYRYPNPNVHQVPKLFPIIGIIFTAGLLVLQL